MSTDVREIWERTEERLSRIFDPDYWKEEGFDLEDDNPTFLFMENEVLEIKREQYLSNGKWITQYYTLVLGTGGPHVEFQTDHNINVYWGGEKAEFTFAKEHTDLHCFNFDGLEALMNNLCKAKVPIYFTIDLDCLDPSQMPGTGTPEAGGITFHQLLDSVLAMSHLNVVGIDVNELAPIYDQSGASTALASKLTREIMIAVSKNRAK